MEVDKPQNIIHILNIAHSVLFISENSSNKSKKYKSDFHDPPKGELDNSGQGIISGIQNVLN